MRWNESGDMLAVAIVHTLVSVAACAAVWLLRDLAWGTWLIGLMAVFMTVYTVSMWRHGFRPLPALDPVPRLARVIAIDKRIAAEDEPELIRVRVADHTGGKHWNSALADLIPPREHHRFAVGSQWNVYVFQRSRARVLLTEDHEDVLRTGYDLSGVRMGVEQHPDHSGPKPGSPLLRRRFATPKRRRPMP